MNYDILLLHIDIFLFYIIIQFGYSSSSGERAIIQEARSRGGAKWLKREHNKVRMRFIGHSPRRDRIALALLSILCAFRKHTISLKNFYWKKRKKITK